MQLCYAGELLIALALFFIWHDWQDRLKAKAASAATIDSTHPGAADAR
jgi:hypothetical protein